MKKALLIGTAVIAATAVSPAMAQTVASGTVQVLGNVQAKCTASNPISDTINLGELAISDGTINPTFSANVGGLSRSFTVRCTSANTQITVSSNALTNTTDATTGAGYTGTVHYTSTLTAVKAGGGTTDAVYTTADTLPAATTEQLGDRLANSADNVTVTVSNGHTTNTGDLLKSGSYSSTISITVAPV